MIHFILLFSRQGKLRLQKWYEARDSKDKKKIIRDLTGLILQRKPKMCNFIEYKDMCIVYKRYASLFFCFAVDKTDNELGVLEVIHRYVEVLDKYFGSVCELDIIFNFEKGKFQDLFYSYSIHLYFFILSSNFALLCSILHTRRTSARRRDAGKLTIVLFDRQER